MTRQKNPFLLELNHVQIKVFVGLAFVGSVGNEDLGLCEVRDVQDGFPVEGKDLPHGAGVQLNQVGQVGPKCVERLGISG